MTLENLSEKMACPAMTRMCSIDYMQHILDQNKLKAPTSANSDPSQRFGIWTGHECPRRIRTLEMQQPAVRIFGRNELREDAGSQRSLSGRRWVNLLEPFRIRPGRHVVMWFSFLGRRGSPANHCISWRGCDQSWHFAHWTGR